MGNACDAGERRERAVRALGSRTGLRGTTVRGIYAAAVSSHVRNSSFSALSIAAAAAAGYGDPRPRPKRRGILKKRPRRSRRAERFSRNPRPITYPSVWRVRAEGGAALPGTLDRERERESDKDK